jgi:hypothetical protein
VIVLGPGPRHPVSAVGHTRHPGKNDLNWIERWGNPRVDTRAWGGWKNLMLIPPKELAAVWGDRAYRLPESNDRQGSGVAPSATRVSFH